MYCKGYNYFCTPKNKTAADYINEWIKEAEEIITAQGQSIEQLEKDVTNLKNVLNDEGTQIDLAKLGAIIDGVQFDEGDTIQFVNFPIADWEGVSDSFKLVVADENNVPKVTNIRFDEDSEATKKYLSQYGTWEDIPEIPELVNTVNTTWQELVTLRNTNKLVPGTFYRITDYVTEVFAGLNKYKRYKRVGSDEVAFEYDCYLTSAKHQFDIIVYATGVNTLNENAYAAHHAGDGYFDSIYAETPGWTIKYCLDNDYTRFNNVNAYKTFFYADGVYVRWENGDRTNLYCWRKITKDFGNAELENLYYYIQNNLSIPDSVWGDTEEYVYTHTENITIGEPLYDVNGDLLDRYWVNDVSFTSKGYIYYMKDQWGNEAPYDFKNVQFNLTIGNYDNVIQYPVTHRNKNSERIYADTPKRFCRYFTFNTYPIEGPHLLPPAPTEFYVNDLSQNTLGSCKNNKLHAYTTTEGESSAVCIPLFVFVPKAQDECIIEGNDIDGDSLVLISNVIRNNSIKHTYFGYIDANAIEGNNVDRLVNSQIFGYQGVTFNTLKLIQDTIFVDSEDAGLVDNCVMGKITNSIMRKSITWSNINASSGSILESIASGNIDYSIGNYLSTLSFVNLKDCGTCSFYRIGHCNIGSISDSTLTDVSYSTIGLGVNEATIEDCEDITVGNGVTYIDMLHVSKGHVHSGIRGTSQTGPKEIKNYEATDTYYEFVPTNHLEIEI